MDIHTANKNSYNRGETGPTANSSVATRGGGDAESSFDEYLPFLVKPGVKREGGKRNGHSRIVSL